MRPSGEASPRAPGIEAHCIIEVGDEDDLRNTGYGVFGHLIIRF